MYLFLPTPCYCNALDELYLLAGRRRIFVEQLATRPTSSSFESLMLQMFHDFEIVSSGQYLFTVILYETCLKWPTSYLSSQFGIMLFVNVLCVYQNVIVICHFPVITMSNIVHTVISLFKSVNIILNVNTFYQSGLTDML